jgi:hypothetical protein
MAAVFNRTTKQYLISVNTPDYSPSEWLINPDITPVRGHDPRVWVINPDDTLRLMTDAEMDAEFLEGYKLTWSNKVNEHRERVIGNGMWYMGYLFDTDNTARDNIVATVSAINAGMVLPPDFVWRDGSNHNVPMTAQQVTTMGIMMLGYINQIYAHSWTLKAQISACATRAEVRAIDVTLGWPSNNVDGSQPT